MVGFQELHKHKIMHRDFKLANLFVNDDTQIIGDFGFAKSGFDMAQTKLGTPLTMAPEQLMDANSYTSKADLWSIGVVFYQLMFGDPPFFALSINELIGAIKKSSGQNLKIPRSINNISQEAEEILKSLLQMDPKQRQDWNEFFSHRIFSDNKSKTDAKNAVGQFIGNFIIKKASKVNVDDKFNQLRDQGVVHNTVAVNPQQLGVDITAQKVEEDSSHNTTNYLNQHNAQSEAQETFKENAFRYFHEKNKIQFIFLTVKQLRQIMKHNAFVNHAPSIYILILCLAKKGIIQSELNVMSLKKGNNIFNLPNFSTFTETENCAMAIRSQLEDQPSLFEYFNYLKNKTNEISLKKEDMTMIQSLNEPYVYLPTLDQMSKSKYDELRNIPNPQYLSHDTQLRHDYFLVLVYTLYAIKSEPHFPYSDKGKKFEWETFRQRHEQMSDEQLRQLIQALNN